MNGYGSRPGTIWEYASVRIHPLREIFSYSEAGHSKVASVHSEEKQRGSGESDSVLYSALPHSVYRERSEIMPENLNPEKYLPMVSRTERITALICIMPF